MPQIYPRGKSRAPVKDRLNAAFSNHVFEIANEEQARLFSQFIKGWDTVVGLEKVKEVKLRFPKNNLALNKLIRIVMGDEMDTFQKPGSSNNKDDANYAPAGLMLKSVEKFGNQTSSLQEMLQKKTRCFNPQCPLAKQLGHNDIPVKMLDSCSLKHTRQCAATKKRPQQGMRRR